MTNKLIKRVAQDIMDSPDYETIRDAKIGQGYDNTLAIVFLASNQMNELHKRYWQALEAEAHKIASEFTTLTHMTYKVVWAWSGYKVVNVETGKIVSNVRYSYI